MDPSSTNPYSGLPRPAAAVAREPLAEDPFLASRGARFGAAMLDAALFFLALLVGLLGPAVLLGVWPDSLLGYAVAVPLGLTPLLSTVTQAVLISARGQSVGKLLLRIRVVDADGRNPGFLRAYLLREGGRLVLTFIPYIGIMLRLVDLLMITRHDRRTLHDQLAGTFVVEAPR